MIIDLTSLPLDYREFSKNGFNLEISSRVLNPALKVTRSGRQCSLVLGGVVNKQGQKIFYEALSLKHNWVVDNGVIKALPFNIVSYLFDDLQLGSLENLTIPEIINLKHRLSGDIELILTEDFLEKANSKSIKLFFDQEKINLNAKLFPYQEQGVAWLCETIEKFGGAILADEMGLGKSIQIIAMFLLNPPSYESPALILCPTSLIANWQREINKFAPQLTVLIHRGSDRTGFYKDLMRSDVVITTYETCVNDITLFRGVDWHYLVCDEAQAVKNPDSKRRQVLDLIGRRYSIPVTGTPIENKLLDLWSLSDLAVPGYLGQRDEFTKNYPETVEGALDLSNVTDIIVLKRQVSDVAQDLPQRTDIDIPIELSQSDWQSYENLRKMIIDEYGLAGQLVAVGQLAIYCAHPWLRSKEGVDVFDQVELVENSKYQLLTPKMELCISILKEAFLQNKKVLVFVAYNKCGELIQRALAESGCVKHYCNSINGGTPSNDRQAIVDEFTEVSGPALLILNPKAAGAGLNITAATIVVHYTQNWNPALETQASARAHRRGQVQPVTVYRLYYQSTVEETMIDRSQWKRELGNAAIPISTRDNHDITRALSKSPVRGSHEN